MLKYLVSIRYLELTCVKQKRSKTMLGVSIWLWKLIVLYRIIMQSPKKQLLAETCLEWRFSYFIHCKSLREHFRVEEPEKYNEWRLAKGLSELNYKAKMNPHREERGRQLRLQSSMAEIVKLTGNSFQIHTKGRGTMAIKVGFLRGMMRWGTILKRKGMALNNMADGKDAQMLMRMLRCRIMQECTILEPVLFILKPEV
ncbi:hypothetical protein LINPERPRIM_LOCUS25178 [Linum perenne]